MRPAILMRATVTCVLQLSMLSLMSCLLSRADSGIGLTLCQDPSVFCHKPLFLLPMPPGLYDQFSNGFECRELSVWEGDVVRDASGTVLQHDFKLDYMKFTPTPIFRFCLWRLLVQK